MGQRRLLEAASAMRLILSRKGFDSTSGGCPNPIFPDGSMLALPIPDKTSPVRYRDLVWRGRNVGDLVEHLTKGKRRRDYAAHLDPDIRRELRPRAPGWKPVLGQRGSAQGHLRNQGVGVGDLFLFWGLFRAVDAELRWVGPRLNVIWGWLRVGAVAAVDDVVRPGISEDWNWVADHPHLAFGADRTNTLYVAANGGSPSKAPLSAGVFDFFAPGRQLTAPGATRPLTWVLPSWFLPKGRRALSYHDASSRWVRRGGSVHLNAVSRGQEFVLDVSEYSEAEEWAHRLIRSGQSW